VASGPVEPSMPVRRRSPNKVRSVGYLPRARPAGVWPPLHAHEGCPTLGGASSDTCGQAVARSGNAQAPGGVYAGRVMARARYRSCPNRRLRPSVRGPRTRRRWTLDGPPNQQRACETGSWLTSTVVSGVDLMWLWPLASSPTLATEVSRPFGRHDVYGGVLIEPT
jgi:hypothetical protein